ncbi:MAG: aerobic carbon-monoxide dehydrogenase large subunit [Bradyrhizobium sp.]|nr:aerobic carbon-monoxide dehydrogenase large subunit [Bradyrhizobium sp.]
MTAKHQESGSPLRKEDARILLGGGRYVDNIHLDRMVHGVFIRSPVAHARIVRIDASAATAAGALLVLTAADLPFAEKPWVVRYWHEAIRGGLPGFLANDRVRYLGEPVAFLVAGDRYVAEDLAELVEIQYDALPALGSMAAALAPDAPQLHDGWTRNVAAAFGHVHGDPDGAMTAAAHRVRHSFSFARQTPLALEGRGVVAQYDSGSENLTVWMSTQAHYNVRQNLAGILDLPEYQVRVIAEDVGGGFGAKSRCYPEEIVVSHVARLLRRPVKWIEDRFENLQATTHSRAIDIDLELGCDTDGRFVALKADVKADIGGYIYTSGIMTSEVAMAHLVNGYRIDNFQIGVRCVGTNKTPIATYRGAGQPEAAFPIECIIDVLAKELSASALKIRELNIIRPVDLPFLSGAVLAKNPVVFESGDFPALIGQAVTDSGYNETVEDGPDGCRTAWGMACGIEASGLVNFESALVRIDAAGNVIVLSGMTTQGQGQLTTYAQVCANALGVDLDRVQVRMGDTQLMPFGRGAFASRGAVFGASAVHEASLALRKKVLGYAGTLLQCDYSVLTISGGFIHQSGKATELDVGAIARAMTPGGSLFDGSGALEAQHVFKADQPLTYGLSIHLAKVRVEPRTGFFTIVDYLVAHDAGRSMNKMIVDGQVVGGAVDGIGGALFSELIYDEDGQLLTGSLADYLVATASEVPRIRLSHMETIPSTNPLGVRGIGEAGVIPAAPAIANALARAIAPFTTGHERSLFTLPLKQERVYRSLLAAAKSASERHDAA